MTSTMENERKTCENWSDKAIDKFFRALAEWKGWPLYYRIRSVFVAVLGFAVMTHPSPLSPFAALILLMPSIGEIVDDIFDIKNYSQSPSWCTSH